MSHTCAVIWALEHYLGAFVEDSHISKPTRAHITEEVRGSAVILLLSKPTTQW